MSEYLIPDEDINFPDGSSLKCTANVPKPLAKEFNKLSVNNHEGYEDTVDMAYDVVKKILYLKNDKAKVDKLVDSLGMQEVTIIANFIGEFHERVIASKNPKKKDSKE